MGNVSVRKRSNGWEYNFYTAVVDGKRGRKYKGGFKTKSEALKEGIKAKAEYDQTGIAFTPSEQSVSDYLDYWIENYAKKELLETTVYGYEKKIRLYIKPHIGDYKLKLITQETLRKLIYQLHESKLSRNTLSGIKGILSKSFEYAVEAKFIATNPAFGLKLPNKRADTKVGSNKKNRIVTPPDKWQEIIERFPYGSSSHIPLMLAYHCGLRLGEIFALTWDCVDFDKKTIDINKQVQEHEKKWYFRNPKYDSFRVISISDSICDLLETEKHFQEVCKEYAGEYYILTKMNYDSETKQILRDAEQKEISFVNVRQDGSWINPSITKHTARVIHGLAKNSHVIMEEWDMHSLRHTHATMLVEAGIPMPVIQKRLGHIDISTTKHYANHVTETMEENLIKYLNLPPKNLK